jgi:hypothetical protein
MQPPINNSHVILKFYRIYHKKERRRQHFNLLVMSCNFNNIINFVTLGSTSLRFPVEY